MATSHRRVARLKDHLVAFLVHFKPDRISRFVKAFGWAAACRQVGIEIRQFVRSMLDRGGKEPRVINNAGRIELQGLAKENVTVSVAIPVKNAGDQFRLLLSALRAQQGFKNVETVVVDSGSTDGSVEVARQFGARVVEILPEEFSHSYARNLAAEQAAGDYILFTVQDALPSSNLWLYELFAALKNNGVAAVSCAEYPREDADLFYRACSWAHYRFLEIDGKDRILSNPEIKNYLSLRKNAQLSDLACLLSKELFLKYRFNGNYAEDLELGLRLIQDGHKLALLSSTKVIHSHNRPAYYYLKRGYVDGVSLCQIFPDCPIQTIEPHRLLREIVFVRRSLESMIDRLAWLAGAVPVSTVSSLVRDHYRQFSRISQTGGVACLENHYLDRNFSVFLGGLDKKYGLTTDDKRERRGVFAGAVRDATGTILEYLDDAYEVVDEMVVEEFKSCLFKLFAFQCGTYLGACYFRGTAATKSALEEMNRELTAGV